MKGTLLFMILLEFKKVRPQERLQTNLNEKDDAFKQNKFLLIN
jgi:hypothetical protein